MWRVLVGKPESLIDCSEQLADLIIMGIASPKEEKVWNFRITMDPDEKSEKGKLLPGKIRKQSSPSKS